MAKIFPQGLTQAQAYADEDGEWWLVGWIDESPVTDEIPVDGVADATELLRMGGYDTIFTPEGDLMGWGRSVDENGNEQFFARIQRVGN